MFLPNSKLGTAEPCSELRSQGSDKLLIIFAHRDAERFAFQSVTETLDCDRLFLRDPSLRSWYNEGIPEFGNDVESIARDIRGIIREGRYAKTSALGSSMGGYAAILFGVMAEVDQVLAFNPQTVLDRLFPLSPPADVAIAVQDLNNVLAGPRTTRVDIVISQDDAVDLFHAAKISRQAAVQVWWAPGTGHTLTDQLNRRGDLRRLLQQWCDHRPFGAVQRLRLLDDEAFADDAEVGVRNYMAGDHEAALAALVSCSARFPAHCGLALFLGLTAAELRQWDIAVPALRAALTLRPTWSHAEARLRSILDEGHTIVDDPAPDLLPPSENFAALFTGIGSDINAAVIDAIGNATGSARADAAISVEVVSWGVKNIAAGGAKSFWATVRRLTSD